MLSSKLIVLLLLPWIASGAVIDHKKLVNHSSSSSVSQKSNAKPKPVSKPRPLAKPKPELVGYLTNEFALVNRVYKEFPVWHAPLATLSEPWPRVKSETRLNRMYLLDLSRLSFDLVNVDNDILRSGIKRVTHIVVVRRAVSAIRASPRPRHIMEHSRKANGILTSVVVNVMHPGNLWPHLGMDESYRLEVNANKVTISASETWGALRGLETFMQLLWRTSAQTIFINETKILDEPKHLHRGFLLDTARHFMTVGTILMNLDAMAANKLNVLHWHMTDDQSFPFQSETYPRLARAGSYFGRVYTKAQIREIIEYARLLGIRVIPEFDSPAHSNSWGKAFPFLLTECFSGTTSDGYYGPLNPARQETYNFLLKLYTEIIDLFPDSYVHLGLDEVPTTCWMSNPEIRGLMRELKISDPQQVTKYYVERLQTVVKKAEQALSKKRKHIMWQEGARSGANLLDGTVVQVWYGNINDVKTQATMGRKVLFSNCWYLDTMTHWSQAYQCDLGSDEPWKKNFLGGDACMWAEKVSDASMMQKAWPAASAAAERLWSHSTDSLEVAGARLEEQRCRMIMRGIRVGVASGPGSCPYFNPKEIFKPRLRDEEDSSSNMRMVTRSSGRFHMETVFYFISTISCLTLVIIVISALRPKLPVITSTFRTKFAERPRTFILSIFALLMTGFAVAWLMTSNRQTESVVSVK